MDGVVDSFYRMLTLSQLQKLLRCSRATLYRTVKRAKIELYYVPNHPGRKYIWGCSLLKLIGTPALRKAVKYLSCKEVSNEVNVPEIASKLNLTSEQTSIGIECGLIPLIDNNPPWWFVKAVKGFFVLPLPYR